MAVARRMKVLVLNAGSSSLKFDLWETTPETIATNSDLRLAQGEVERVTDIDEAFQKVFDTIGDVSVEAVGHRIVHGGDRYHTSVIIDEQVERDIDQLGALAPLHNPHNLAGVRAARKHLPQAKHVAVFDTAFHHTLPPFAYAYGLPYEYLVEKKIRRYGFHGISHRYVSWWFAQINKSAGHRLITCHLGNGCSVCAVVNGRSIDTSMGFTPLEGLLMGTRAGDVDAGAILYLITQEKQAPQEVLKMLNSDSGLKGLSGVSNDMRDVLKSAETGDERAQSCRGCILLPRAKVYRLLSRRDGRGGCPDLHRRHRRKLSGDPGKDLRRANLTRHGRRSGGKHRRKQKCQADRQLRSARLGRAHSGGTANRAGHVEVRSGNPA